MISVTSLPGCNRHDSRVDKLKRVQQKLVVTATCKGLHLNVFPIEERGNGRKGQGINGAFGDQRFKLQALL